MHYGETGTGEPALPSGQRRRSSFIALALLWIVARRSWRTLVVALTATFAFTLTPILFRGTAGFFEDVQAFRALAATGWPVRPTNQSVFAMWGRYLVQDGAEGYAVVTPDAIGVMVLSAAVIGGFAALVLVPVARRGSRGDPAAELAQVNAVGALASLIAWEHYFVAWFPVLLALRVSARGASRAAYWAFWIGVLFLTGLSRATLGPEGGWFVRTLSLTTVGGLVTCGTLALLLARRPHLRHRSERAWAHRAACTGGCSGRTAASQRPGPRSGLRLTGGLAAGPDIMRIS
jgi:hypothetical protein